MTSLIRKMPSVEPFTPNPGSIRESLFIAAAGFEPRATAVLETLLRERLSPSVVLRVEYDPATGQNRLDEFDRLLSLFPSADVYHMKFDRTDPEGLQEQLPNVLSKCLHGVRRVILDISAMSKMLILVLLHALKGFEGAVEIVYAEALDYGPKMGESADTLPEGTDPDLLLSSGIRNIATTSTFSSAAMQGCPHALVAFAGFNRHQLLTLYNELTPQFFYLVNCDASYPEHLWRQGAIQTLNAQLWAVASDVKTVETRNYQQAVQVLEDLYNPLKYTHKFVVSPTGSKMQTLGVFIFKCLHPDVQIVYPTPRSYSKHYSTGVRALWTVTFPHFQQFLNSLDAFRLGGLEDLRLRLGEPDGEH